VTLRETIPKTLDVQTTHTGLAFVDAAQEPDIPVVREKIDDLVVHRLVDEVAIDVLDAADLVDVLLDCELVLQLFNPGCKGCDVVHAVCSPIGLLKPARLRPGRVRSPGSRPASRAGPAPSASGQSVAPPS